jgi:hypothetical protein
VACGRASSNERARLSLLLFRFSLSLTRQTDVIATGYSMGLVEG